MVLHYEWGSTTEALSDDDIRKAVHGVFDQLGKKYVKFGIRSRGSIARN